MQFDLLGDCLNFREDCPGVGQNQKVKVFILEHWNPLVRESEVPLWEAFRAQEFDQLVCFPFALLYLVARHLILLMCKA